MTSLDDILIATMVEYSEFSLIATVLSAKPLNPPQFPSTNIMYKYQ